jgi:hypothetical protein
MGTRDRRKHKRLRLQFKTILSQMGLNVPVEGITENLSQGGAFVKTSNWPNFQIDDKAVVAFFLPPSFTGLDETLGLHGTAVVARTDKENEGIGLRFTEDFRHFEWI